MSLAGKTLFITGASRGIGLAIALRAARDGANIVVAAKSNVPTPKLPGTIHTAAAEIEKAGGKALPVVCDIRSEDQVAAAVAKLLRDKFGRAAMQIGRVHEGVKFAVRERFHGNNLTAKYAKYTKQKRRRDFSRRRVR